MPVQNTPRTPVAPVEPPAAPVPMTEMEQLRALLAKFGAAEVAKLVKEVAAEKQTLLSVTMDAIIAAGDTLITDNVVKAVTVTGREAGVLKKDEEASVTSVGQLVRHVQAYRAACKRADDAKAKTAAEVAKLPTESPEAAGVVAGGTYGEAKPAVPSAA